MGYRLICFDAGFTLIEPRRTTAATMAAILADEGITPTHEALRRAWDAADRWFWEEYHRPDNDTWASDEQIVRLWRRHYSIMLRELEVDDPDYRIADAVIDSYAKAENWQVYPDAVPTLKQLHSAGFAIGIVSDWGSQLPLILDKLGLTPYLTFVQASAIVGAAKPSPIFYRMAAQAGGVDPSEALMVGDSYRADVMGARSAGMDAVLLDRAGTAQVSDVTIIRSLDEVLSLVGAPPDPRPLGPAATPTKR